MQSRHVGDGSPAIMCAKWTSTRWVLHSDYDEC
jgi:hypothetical protein